MKIQEVIRSRRSVRTFDGNGLRQEDAKKQGLSSPVIVGTDVYIAGKMRRAPHAEKAFGYSFEKVVLPSKEPLQYIASYVIR